MKKNLLFSLVNKFIVPKYSLLQSVVHMGTKRDSRHCRSGVKFGYSGNVV